MKNKKTKIILVILLAIIVGCLIFIGQYYWKLSHNGKVYEELQTEVKKQEPVTEQVVQETETQEVIPIDFTQLADLNPDIYAWIEIPETQVAYPVLQSPGNDDYYLDTTVEGNHGLPGSIYSQASYNGTDFTDFNTILYGHDMKDGSIFGTLKGYREVDYWTEHPEIVIYQPEKKLTYRIFAAVVYNDELIPYKYDFSTAEGRQGFIDSLYDNSDSRSLVDREIEVTTDSKLLTLSTCIGSESNHRYLVVGVLE